MSWASPVRLRAARIVHSLRPETSPERGSESLERGNDLSGHGARRNTPKGAAARLGSTVARDLSATVLETNHGAARDGARRPAVAVE